MTNFTIRKAVPGDEALVGALLGELAAYEKLEDRFALTEAAIARDMVGLGAVCPCALAFAGEEAAGIAAWLWSYKTFRARRCLYLEDLYVRPAFRGQGLGRGFFTWLAGEAAAYDAFAMEWRVLDWNTPSIAFYEGLGARPVTEWINYRLEGAGLAALAGP